ncbi:MAG: HAD family hydrolase [Treponema sp.]|uniref:HAD family hydrolase n=1 Tax=Treponema sp. TaxID=166 RepID=UPI002A90F9D5|nr:HAD family hydrolase [Treponema sp.]MDY6396743.1 HAD family hydrolase [Treponema sp.]
MMKTIFFDLDDTLYFRRDAFFLAFDEFFGGKHANLKVFANDRCRIRGDEVFFKCQNGEITELEMYIFRFKTGFADAGIEISREQAEDFYKLYKKHLYSMKLNPQVVSMLDFAKAHFENLGIITNGHSEHQRNKIKTLGLENWISRDLIIISGEHGCPKPDKHLFEIAQEKSGKKPYELLIVGDSFQNDILPADKLGWHTIWINLYGENFSQPEYAVKEISEIPEILKSFNDPE